MEEYKSQSSDGEEEEEKEDEESKHERSSIRKVPGLAQYWGGSIQAKQ